MARMGTTVGEANSAARAAQALAKTAILLMVLSCLPGLSQLHADDQGSADGQTPRLSHEVTVRAKAPAPGSLALIETPGTVTIIPVSADEPRQTSVADILNRAPGVHVQMTGGAHSPATVTLRGATGPHVLIMLDGVPLNTQQGGGVDLSTLPIQEADQIEILRGPASARFGGGAMGGVINIVSTAPRREAFLTAKVNTGSFGERDAAISTGLPLTRHRLTFSSSYAEGDGDFTFRNNNGTEQTDGDDYWDTRRNNWHRSFSAAAAFNGKFTPGTHVRLAGEYFQSDRGVPGLITFPSDHAEQEDRRAIASFRAAHTPAMADGVLTVALSGHLRRSTLNFRDPLGEQTGVPIDSSQTDTAVSVQSTADWRLSSSASADLTLCVDSETLSDRAFGEISRHGLAGILAFDLSLFRQRLHVHPVIRSEQISDAGSHTTGRLSARWDVPGGWQLTGSWGQSFRAPGFNELYLQTGVIEGNPELVSEHGTGGDVSVGYQRGSFHTRATAFRQNSRDLIQYVLISGFRFKPFNIGRARTTGIELELSSGISTWVTASVNYTISRCLDLTDDPNWHGKQIPGRPEHDLSARIAAEGVPLRPFVEYQWLSGNYLTRANTKWLDDRHLINAGLRLKLGSNWQAGAEVKNLGGQQAADVRGFPLPPRGFVLSITCSLGGERP